MTASTNPSASLDIAARPQLARLHEVKAIGGRESETSREQNSWEALDRHVVQLDSVVIKRAAIGNALLERDDSLGGMREGFASFELRIGFRERQQPCRAPAQLCFRASDLPWASGRTR